MDLREQMDAIYADLPLDEIPWHSEEPPAPLVDLVRSRRLPPGRAADLGCGAGSAAIWLAGRDFEVTGIDVSSRAVALAAARAAERGVSCRFLTADLVREVVTPERVGGPCDLVHEWEVLHHVAPADREAYLRNVHGLLRRGGLYLSVCFSEDDPLAGGTGKVRRTRLGTLLHFSSEAELRELFGRLFVVERMETVEVPGRPAPHVAIASLLRPREEPA